MSAERQQIETEVCVIGAGAGGAVVAAELAEAGVEVVLLEQGPHHDPDDFTARPPQMLARLYRDGGQTLTVGDPPILMPLGRGLGGTTLVNSGTCFRTPPAVLRRWRAELGLQIEEAELERCFARVEEALSVVEVTPELAGGNAAVARRGAQALGWSHGYLKRNAKGCVGSGVCAFGCPTSAKQHTGITYVPRARAAGARIVTGADVGRIAMSGDRVSHVEARMAGAGAGERTVHVHARQVVVAAGSIHTPGLLARSGLGAGSAQLGANLSIHPATAAFALMDETVDMGRGVPQSFYVDEFAAEGIIFEGIAGPPSYAAMSLPLKGERHAQAMAAYPRLAQFGLMVSDSSRGRVHSLGAFGRGGAAGLTRQAGAAADAGLTRLRAGGGPLAAAARGMQAPLVTYSLDDADLQRFRTGLEHLQELFLAAGAREVYLPLPEGTRPQDAGRRDLRLMAFHPLGTARADGRPGYGVLDGDLKVHGAEGVYVADGSVVPTSLGVNPQLTIMALATRLAFHLLGRPVPGPADDLEEIPCPS